MPTFHAPYANRSSLAFAAHLALSATAFAGDLQGAAVAAGAPVSGARVTLFSDDLSFFAEARTSLTGSYEFPGVPPGTYLQGLAAVGFEYEQRTVTIGSGLAVQNFTLVPESHQGEWAVIGNTLPEFFDATDMLIYLPDGRVFFCHDTTDPILIRSQAPRAFHRRLARNKVA